MTFDDLHPDGFGQHLVLPNVPAPRRPRPPSGTTNKTTARDYYGPNYLLDYAFADGKAPVAVIDKAFPHSRFDTMLLAADDVPRSGVTDLDASARRFVLESAAEFEGFVRTTDTVPRFDLGRAAVHATFNFNADGFDRENSMYYDKRFHLHLNAFPAEDVAGTAGVRYADLASPNLRVQLADPIGFVAPAVVADACGSSLGGLRCFAWPVRSWPTSLPGGLYIPLSSWADLGSDAFEQALLDHHHVAHDVHAALSRAFTGHAEPPPTWTRRTLLPAPEVDAALAALPWLGADTRSSLSRLRAQLRDIDPAELERLREDPDAAVTRLAISTVDYSLSVVPRSSLPDDAERFLGPFGACAIVNYRLFSDVGGAGLPPLPDTYLAKLDRKAGPLLDDAGLAERAAFRVEFTERVLDRVAARHGGAPSDRTGEGTS